MGLFLRIWQLNSIPRELFGDEIDVGLQANSILHTGKDYYSNSHPLMLQSFTEHRLPIYIYSDIPFVAIFGMNEWGLRLEDVFWGMLGIIGIFLLARKLFNTEVGLIAAGLLSISPWHLQYSRQAGIESLLLLTVLTWALWSFFKGLKQFKWLVVSGVLFALSFYAYAPAALFTTLLLVFLAVYFRKTLFSLGLKKLAIAVGIAFVVLLPFLQLTIQGESTERTKKISIFNDKDIIDEVFVRRTVEHFSKDSAIFHNSLLLTTDEFLRNYFVSLSPDFLFFRGDPNLRQSVADRGELYLVEMVFVGLGLYFLVTRKNKNLPVLLALILIAPIPASITVGGGAHASRLMFLLLPLELLSAVGLFELIKNWRKQMVQLFGVILILLAIVNISTYFHRYYVDWARDSWRFWQSGYKEAFSYLKDHDSEFSRVYINNTYEPALPRFMFWYNYNPATFQSQFSTDHVEPNIAPGFDGFMIDKYYFGEVQNKDFYQGLGNLLQKNEAYLVSTRDEAGAASDWRVSPPQGIKLLKTVVDPFGVPIFYVVTKP